MPYLSHSLWSKVLSYLPNKDKENAQLPQLINELETKLEQRKILKAQAMIPSEQIHYHQITSTTRGTFTFFHSGIYKNAKNAFKFHISISPQDYELVLYKSGLNKLLQEHLIATPDRKTIFSFKYVNPILLQKIKTTDEKTKQYLINFYKQIENYNSIKNQKGSPKPILGENTTLWHKWFTNVLGNSFTPLAKLLEATPTKLDAYKKADFDLLQKIIDTSRIEKEVQFTLYVSIGADRDNLVHLIRQISEYLTKIGVRPVPCPESDLPLIPFVTFRQERFAVNGKYIAANDEEILKLKEYGKNSEVYKNLVLELTHPAQEEEHVPSLS